MSDEVTPAQKRKLPDATKRANRFRSHLWKLIGVSQSKGLLLGDPTRGELLGVINAYHEALVHALVGMEPSPSRSPRRRRQSDEPRRGQHERWTMHLRRVGDAAVLVVPAHRWAA